MLWENIIENIHRLIKIIMQSLLVFSLFLCLGWKLTEIVENYETFEILDFFEENLIEDFLFFSFFEPSLLWIFM